MKVFNVVLGTALVVGLSGCLANQSSETATIQDLWVAPYQAACRFSMAGNHRLGMVLKDQASAAWQQPVECPEGIENFQPQWGHTYQLRVRVVSIDTTGLADSSSIRTEWQKTLQDIEDPVGTEYLLTNVPLELGAITQDTSGVYHLFWNPFSCGTTVDCVALQALDGSNGLVTLRMAYTGDAQIPLQLMGWN